MKAPLTAINGAAAVVLRTVERMEGAPQDRALIEEMARMIASEVSRNVRLLQDIQNYCKPRFELTVRSGSLNHFLESHIDAIGAAAGERRPALVLETDPALPPVAFSREHLVEVLRNFVRNSAESGSARVTVRTERNGRSAIIEVRDEGGGIDEEAIDALFRPYESRKSKSGGSGLGLFICRRIIEEGHGGRVSARNIYEDDARVGLCVRIELPLAPTLEYR
jgi:signal transduction histidine kinase